jgi:hypothetical protein
MTETVQWEYRVQTVGSFWKGVRDAEFTVFLNEWGQEGWEVVGFRAVENSNQAQVIAKRLLTAANRRRSSWPASG